MKYKKLSHISLSNHYQFVTFRTKDSLDKFLLEISNLDIDNSIKQYKIDIHLDGSSNGAYLNDKVLKILKEYIISQDKKLFDLISFVIMPNHIHLLFRETLKLDEAIRKLKGGSSFLINKVLDKKGQFWVDNYYDRMIRDDKHFEIVYNYIKNNPIKAGLKDSKKRFYTVYE